MSPRLTVLIANHNTSAFLELSLTALHRLTDGEFRVLIHDDGSDPADLSALEAIIDGYSNAELFKRPPDPRGGSWAHGRALDFLFEKVETPYTAVFDADCSPLLLGWDSWMIDQLDERTKIVGSGLGEGWSGNKPLDFPLPFLALWETDTYRRLGISAMPAEIEAGRDSCWEWRAKLLEAGYGGKVLRSVNTRFTPMAPFDDVHCGVYLTDEDEIIGSHFGRGSTPAAKRSSMPRRLDDLLRRFGGKRVIARNLARQQKRWRATCYEIVASEATKAAAPR